MNLDKLFAFVIAVVIAWAAVGQLNTLQNWIWRAQAKLIYESRTETWGSPRFFPEGMKSPLILGGKVSRPENQ